MSNMLVPVIRRIKENKKCYIERVLPVDGILSAKVGDFVEPFNPLGECRFSQNELKFPKEFKPNRFKNNKKFYYSGALLGKIRREKILAPYDGNLVFTEEKEYIFEENERKYNLLSGVWGDVISVFNKKAVLLEFQSKDILFSCSTKKHASGELVVFPNPSDVLKKSYLENFTKGIKGKIIYVGHFAGLDIIKRAFEMEAEAVITGSVHSEAFDFAKRNNFALGVFTGFGRIKTPEDIYKFLSSVSYRFVFFEGGRNLLKVPVRNEDLSESASQKKSSKLASGVGDLGLIKNIEPGMDVQVFQDPYFGWIGNVDRVSESSIFVKFGVDDKSVEIRLPNFLIVE